MNPLIKCLEPGGVYRRSDLEFYSASVDRDLAQLVKSGTLVKVKTGLYHMPEVSRFGKVPADDDKLVYRFLKDDRFLILSPNSFNALGLGLTQLHNAVWVYNHKRKGLISLDGKDFLFRIKSSFPERITPEYLFVEFLNNLHLVGDDPPDGERMYLQRIAEWDRDHLVEMTRLYASGSTKKMLKATLRRAYPHV